MSFKGFLCIVVLLTSTLFTQTQLLRLSENCRKRKVASFCKYQGKEYTGYQTATCRKSCAEKKSGFFLRMTGERIHWLPDSYLPEELFGKEKWLLSANIRGKNTLATCQLPTNYQTATCRKSCSDKKSGFFLQISGERIHWPPTSYQPATNQLPASYLPG